MGFLGSFFGFGDAQAKKVVPAGPQRPGLAQPTLLPKSWAASGLKISNGCIQSGRPGLIQPLMMPFKLANQNSPTAPVVDLSTKAIGRTDVGGTQYGYNVSGGLGGWLSGTKKKHGHGRRHGPHHPN